MTTRPAQNRPDPAAPDGETRADGPGVGAGQRSESSSATTARSEETGSAVAPLRAPLETIALAMKTQVDLLRQMQDRQRALEEAVRDEKRHELVINSAQSLNDAFRGMQQSQERLAERLEDGPSGALSRGRWILIAALLVVIAGAVVLLAVIFNRGADDLGEVARKLDAPRVDAEARAALADMEARILGVESADRQAFQAELDRLRRATDAAAVEREALRKERDQAREDLGALRGKTNDAEKLVVEFKAKQEAADKEIARLTTQTVGDQRLISHMNNTLEAFKTKPAPAAPSGTAPGGETASPAGPPGAGEAAFAAAREAALNRLEGDPVAPVAAESAPSGDAAKAAEDAREMPFTPGQRDDLNRLLGRHRGRQTYVVVSAAKILDRTLKNVVLEVRGADGSRDKTVEADSMTVKISPRGEMIDLDFVKGSIVFHSSVAGRDARSPFFNDRYQIVLLGAPTKEWLTAGLNFVSMR